MEADVEAVWTVLFWSLVGASVGVILMLGINLVQNPPWGRSEDDADGGGPPGSSSPTSPSSSPRPDPQPGSGDPEP